jgi:hypothetical protein
MIYVLINVYQNVLPSFMAFGSDIDSSYAFIIEDSVA